MFILFGLLIFIPSTVSVEYKIGMIVARNCCHWTGLYRVGGAMNIAMDHLRNNNIVNGVDFRIIARDTLTEAEGVGNVVTLVRDDDVDVIFGNPSSTITVPSAYLTSHWNFPQISWAATIPTLTDKTTFTTFVRTLGPYSMIGIAFVSIFEKFNWHHVGMLHADSGGCLWAMDGVFGAFQRTNISIVQRIEYVRGVIPAHDLDRYLLMLKRLSRIIIVCDNTYIRDIMIRACEMNMCNGDYVFMMPGITVAATFDETRMWHNDDERDGAAQHAFRYLLYVFVFADGGTFLSVNLHVQVSWFVFVTVYSALGTIIRESPSQFKNRIMAQVYVTYANWYGKDGRENFIQFMKDVIDRTMDPPWNDDTAKVQNKEASTFAMNLFDAMYVYGLWVNYTITNGVDHKDGRALMEYINGLSFVSPMSGPCHFENGDRVPLYWIWDFTHAEGYARIAAICNTAKESDMVEDDGEWKGFAWQTQNGKAPPDSPYCGFFNELCPEVVKDNTAVILVTCLSILLLTVAGSILAYVYRKHQLEYNMMRMIWKIDIDEIELQKSRTGVGSKINFATLSQSMSQMSVRSDGSANTAVTGSVKGPVLTPVGLFKGQLVAVKQLPKFPSELSRSDLMELKEMREMQHDNINPFLGACINSPNPCGLYLYCPKGSLQDILENDDIDLDLVFKNSLMMDLAEGMYYLHCSGIGSHGRLKSTNCLVDSRWVLKITDYGLSPFLDDFDFSKFEEAQHYKSLLWTAPELLTSTDCPRNGTKAGDIYSFGIILHEIFYRMGTFAGKSYMTAKDIIGRVRNREISPCRPEIFSDQPVTPTVAKLMQLCWIDNEIYRPTFSHVRSYIKKNIKGTTKNIVDIILQRLEKYASNLEDLVDQRTQQLMEEKQKTDKLLYRMLPPSCAEELKAGDIVQPEVFESATVFFSDIVGFTTIAAMSSPIQVIDLLNDLYTCFDDIIAKHDAYKVETIGDAYLVVSGIPTRNGDRHAGEIADMSLCILSALLQFRPKHLPERKINVRIGVHTGSCCAGVVGLSMPRYCLFGDTVNTASRMESTGMANRIHTSEATCKALNLAGGYFTSLRGEIEVKGKGVMRTYWLDGKEGFDGALPHLVE